MGACCVPLVVRLSIIDYLREWRMTERMEHMHKSLTRDLLVGERNHAVVPVREFGRRFENFFDANLFTPLPPPPPLAFGLVHVLRDATAQLDPRVVRRIRDGWRGARDGGGGSAAFVQTQKLLSAGCALGGRPGDLASQAARGRGAWRAREGRA